MEQITTEIGPIAIGVSILLFLVAWRLSIKPGQWLRMMLMMVVISFGGAIVGMVLGTIVDFEGLMLLGVTVAIAQVIAFGALLHSFFKVEVKSFEYWVVLVAFVLLAFSMNLIAV